MRPFACSSEASSRTAGEHRHHHRHVHHHDTITTTTDTIATFSIRRRASSSPLLLTVSTPPRVKEFPFGCVAPITVLWAPSDCAATANDGDKRKNDQDTGDNNATSACEAGGGDRRAAEATEVGGTGEPPDGLEEQEEDIRRVWVWVHPAAAKEALREIRKACDLEGSPWQDCVQVGAAPPTILFFS